MVANAAADTFVVVDLCLSVVLEVDGILRTVHIAASCYATAAKVCNLIVYLYARRTSLVNYCKDLFFKVFLSCYSCLGII